jgi:hypothetical protein
MRTEGDPVGYLARFGIPGGEARKLGPKTIIGTKPCFISGAKTYCERSCTCRLRLVRSLLLAYHQHKRPRTPYLEVLPHRHRAGSAFCNADIVMCFRPNLAIVQAITGLRVVSSEARH